MNVRLNGVENEPLGIVSIQDALRMSAEADVDLVEIAATADPPVCRLMDYGKVKHQEQKKAAEASLIRIHADKLDQLIDLVGELVIAGASANLLARKSAEGTLVEAT